jgi:hypothetical protein
MATESQTLPSELAPQTEAAVAAPVERVKTRELWAVLGLLVLADITVYRCQGFAGMTALFAVAPFLLHCGVPQRRFGGDIWMTGALLVLLAAALLWCGTVWQVALGALLLFAFATTLAGMRPYAADVFILATMTLVTGGAGLTQYLQSLERDGRRVPRGAWLKVGLPLAAVLGFGTLFICANPDEAKTIGQWLSSAWKTIWEFVPTGAEFLVWIATAWIAGGLLRPLVKTSLFTAPSEPAVGDERGASPLFETPLFAAVRNTLIAVIVLFAAYLVFEFQSLWFRQFPKGFYYAGYAHEGAAWLTAALALATIVLSAIFRGAVLVDPRLPRLRRLAWIWSAENLLLAIAVYHRLYIYIGFNGMTRMRTVGLLGMTAVVVGFGLVVYKIANGRGFLWLVNRQLWTLALAVYLYAVLPVDVLVHSYNVRRILAGELAPSVQISVHPIDSGGILVLHPLVNCADQDIREGVKAMLAERAGLAEQTELKRASKNWTSFQLADRQLLRQLRAVENDWKEYADATKRNAAWQRFKDYAYQWY